MAVAEGYNGAYAYGYSSGARSVEHAKQDALLQCRVRQKLYKINNECEIYMVNNKKVQK